LALTTKFRRFVRTLLATVSTDPGRAQAKDVNSWHLTYRKAFRNNRLHPYDHYSSPRGSTIVNKDNQLFTKFTNIRGHSQRLP